MPELITAHKLNDADRDGLRIEARPVEPDAAENSYFVYDPEWIQKAPHGFYCQLNFQYGPRGENGINGLTMESLIAVLIHRLDGFQAGPFACQENYHARKHLAMALECLHARTRERINKGVEGTLEP